MALTLNAMQEAVLNRLDDSSFQTEFLNNALNWAQWDITNGRNFTFLETSLVQTLTQGSRTVNYPTDLQSLISIRAYSSTIPSYDITAHYLDYADFQRQVLLYPQTPATNPIIWTTFANQVLFFSPASTDFTITIDYIRTSPLVDGVTVTTFDIPAQYQELLMIGTYMRIVKMEDNYDVSDAELKDYNRLLLDLIHTYSRNRGPRRKHVMRSTGA